MILQVFPHKRNLCEQQQQNQIALRAEMRRDPLYRKSNTGKACPCLPGPVCGWFHFLVVNWFMQMAPYGPLIPTVTCPGFTGYCAPFSPLFHFHLVFEGHTWAGSPPTFSRQCPLSGREVETSRLVLFWLPRGQQRLPGAKHETTEDPHSFKLSRPRCILWR